MTIATTVNSSVCPTTAESPKEKYPTIKELKNIYESYTKAAAGLPLAHKMLKKSKVKQIAYMFDSKLTCGNVDSAKNNDKYAPDQPPEAKLQIKPPVPAARHLTKNKFDQQVPPVPSPRTKSKLKAQQNSNTFFVSEDGFAKLTVKHKVQLYNQFINEMSRKNPKFVKHAELMEASIKKADIRGEVVNEKQASVKQLLAKLEANCTFPRQKVSPLALNSISTGKNVISTLPIKAKEFEDILEKPLNHISTLTVKLQSTETIDCSRERRSKSLPRFGTENKEDLKSAVSVEAAQKRNNEQMRYSQPFEAYAPPKKIRRTRAERLAPKIFFQSPQLKNLFFTWLSERKQKPPTAKGGEPAADISNSTIDQLLDETLAKLENKETDSGSSKANESEPTEPPKPRQRKKKPAPPIPVTKANNCQTNISSKHNPNDESGLSVLQKITSDESQADNPKTNSDKDFEFAKPLRPVRKKKLRRALTWRKGESSEETTPITNSTDSDTDLKLAETKSSSLFGQPPAQQVSHLQFSNQPSSEELDSDFLREVNSPRKVKSAYTLTAYSPSLSQEEEEKIKYLRREISYNYSAAFENSSSSNQEERDRNKYLKRGASAEQQLGSQDKGSSLDATVSNMFDSFIDQGFETGSNDMDSPARAPKSSTFRIQDTQQSDSLFSQLPPVSSLKQTANPSHFSTPLKECQSTQLHNLPQQQLCSPIAIPSKSRRKSIYDNEPRRSSLAMQVIREDQPLEAYKNPARCSDSAKEENFAALNMRADLAGLRAEQTSQFWIKCGYFSLSFDIFYNDADRLRLLYNIFSQKSCDTKDLYFGIDNLIFPVSQSYEKEDFPKRLPLKKEYSHYWVCTDDLIIPFAGKRVAPDKIQHIFEFLKTSIEDSGTIRFGVDTVEFSNVREFWNQSPKFSMDSNYSMLVGLQSGDSNGLEGRSKYAWPHTTKPARLSDLDQSNNVSDDFDETNSGRSSLSPFSDRNFGFTTSSPTEPHPSTATRSSEVFGFDYKNVSLDHLFNEEYKEPPQPSAALTLNQIKTQQERLSLVQEKLLNYKNLANVSCEALDALKGTPQYLQSLKSIVTKIIEKGRRDGFNGCSFQELESYMFFLSRYADICLHDCSDHIDKLLNALLDHRAVAV